MISDPQGAAFYLMKPIPPAGDPDATSDVFEGMRTVVADLAGLPEAASRKQGAFQKISSLCDTVYTRVEDMREIIRYLRTIAVTVKITARRNRGSRRPRG